MQHRYPCGGLSRRQFFSAGGIAVPLISAAATSARVEGSDATGTVTHQEGDGKTLTKLAAPGLYPGHVVEVRNPGMYRNGIRDAAAIKATLDRGIKELTGATDAVDGWKHFFEPGDVVGIKVVPNGQPDAHSSFEIVLEVIEKLKAAGVKASDMFVYDRFRGELMQAGYHKILPGGIRWGGLDPEGGSQFTLDFPSFAGDPIAGFDHDAFVWMDLVEYGADVKDERMYRSHLGKLITKTVNKIVAIPVLKDHASAGVTGALEKHEPRHGQQREPVAQHAVHQRLQPVHTPDGDPSDHPSEVRLANHGRYPRHLPGRAVFARGRQMELGL